MFIAHLPAGWLLSSSMLDRTPSGDDRTRRRLLALGLVASVLPDIDLLWFYLVSDRREVHHAYWPHLPVAWVTLGIVAALALLVGRASRVAWLALGTMMANVALHLVLDSVAGGVRWGWPWSDHELRLATVTARYRPWWVNFLVHWTFALELALVAAAAWQLGRRRRASRRPGQAA